MARSAHRSTGGHVPWRTYSHTWEIRDVMREAELIPAVTSSCPAAERQPAKPSHRDIQVHAAVSAGVLQPRIYA